MCEVGKGNEANAFYRCRGCDMPMWELGEDHEENSFYRCRGCDRPMCEVGEEHKENAFYRCRGCDRPMCEVGEAKNKETKIYREKTPIKTKNKNIIHKRKNSEIIITKILI